MTKQIIFLNVWHDQELFGPKLQLIDYLGYIFQWYYMQPIFKRYFISNYYYFF